MQTNKRFKKDRQAKKFNSFKLIKLKKFANNKIGVTSKKTFDKIFSIPRLTINRNLSEIGIKYKKIKNTKNTQLDKQENKKFKNN